MVNGTSSEKTNTDRESVLQQLAAFASHATQYEIRHAAHYIVLNLSERTTKKALLDQKVELSKLLERVEDQQLEKIGFEQAFNQLLEMLPDSVPRQVQPMLLHQYQAEPLLVLNSSDGGSNRTSSPIREDESAALLEQRSSPRNCYGGFFRKNK